MQFLFIHSACVAVAVLLPCALCDRITLPLQSIGRRSIPKKTETKIRTEVEGKIMTDYNSKNYRVQGKRKRFENI